MKITIEIGGEERTIELPDETAQLWRRIAARNGLSLETALQQALATRTSLKNNRPTAPGC